MRDEFWDDNERPIAYLITFRTFGTWLHGNERYSVDRHNGKNIFGTPKIEPNAALKDLMQESRRGEEFVLGGKCRAAAERALRNVCERRKYSLFAINIRTNHIHCVVSAPVKPEDVMNAFKANATRELKEAGLVDDGRKIWARGGSTRYLWKANHLDAAIDYVNFGQGEDLPNF